MASTLIGSNLFAQLTPLTNAALDELSGTWVCPGYGKILSIKNRRVEEYHRSPEGCLILPDQSQSILKEQLAFIEILSEDSFVASLAPIGNRYFWERTNDSVSDCLRQPDPSPLSTFDFLVGYMNQHFAFFEESDVDWDSEVARARARITANASDTYLFNTLKNLIEKFDDPHTALYAGIKGELKKTSDLKARNILPILKQNNPNWTGSDFDLFIDWIVQQLSQLESEFIAGNHGVVPTTPFYWRKYDDIAYLHIGSMAGFKPNGNIYQELLAFETALDQAFSDLGNPKALIIDLSFNLGGYEWISIALAQRLARSNIDVFTKQVHQANGKQDLTYTITPSSRPSYHGPIYLLTSDITISAGEACTDAIRALPQTRHYGTRTAGALSNVLSKPLPNGWGITISNERFTDLEGKQHEGIGFSPEVEFTLWDPQDPYEKHSNRIARLLNIINNVDHDIELSWDQLPTVNSLKVNRAEAGSTLAIQYSSDLRNWETIKEISFLEPLAFRFEKPDGANPYFYRVSQL